MSGRAIERIARRGPPVAGGPLSVPFALAFALACAGADRAEAAPKEPTVAATRAAADPDRHRPDAAPPDRREIDICIVRFGLLTRYRVDGERLVVRAPPDVVTVDRTLDAAEIARLSAAARAALADEDTRFTCDRRDGTFVSVVIDHRVAWNSLCHDGARPGVAWRSLMEVAAEIAGAHPPDKRAPSTPSHQR